MRAPARFTLAAWLALAPLFLVALPAGAAVNDPRRAEQWALDKVEADKAWTASTGKGVTIAIIDNGTDLTHNDLRLKIDKAFTCVGGCKPGGQADTYPEDGLYAPDHGTHVAGIAAASANNGIGVAGIAYDARIMPIKVFAEKADSTSGSDVSDAIRKAADEGAKVMNISIGSEIPMGMNASSLFQVQSSINYAYQKGVVVVLAAGNASNSIAGNAGSFNAIVVGATGPDDELANYTDRNVGVDI
jgi:subtilisin family serine protease